MTSFTISINQTNCYIMSSRRVWGINEGFESFPPNTKEYLFIEVDAPDFILTYTLAHTKTAADFENLAISTKDLIDYQEGEHVFVVNFVMEEGYRDTPSKTVKVSAPAYIDISQGMPYHIIAMSEKVIKCRKRKGSTLLIDQQ